MAIAWGALLASISRRWLRVARDRPAARTRPRPPPFSGVSVSGSDTRSQGRGGFLHPPCVQSLSFSLYLTLPFLFSVTSFSPLPVSLVFRSFPFANRCLSLARVATFGRTWWRTPCACGLYGRLRVPRLLIFVVVLAGSSSLRITRVRVKPGGARCEVEPCIREVRLRRTKAITDKWNKGEIVQAERRGRGGWECREKEGIAAIGQEERQW